MATPLFTIIIPVYNGQDIVGLALDSIYSQGLSEDQFEVICVDDCSPTMETFEVLNNYTYNGIHPSNLKVLRHEVNKRQGGARNTGVRSAEGTWIVYLDQDDLLVADCLLQLVRMDSFIYGHDMVMLSHRVEDLTRNTLVKNVFISDDVDMEVMRGAEYLCKNPIGWAPWCYIYGRNFLINNDLFFEENVRWEDLDYVMKAIMLASKMSFVPIEIYHYRLTGQNTSFMGTDKEKIKDWFRMSVRVKMVAERFMWTNKQSAMVVMNHHVYHYSTALKSTLWRLRYSDIFDILRDYPPYTLSANKFLNICVRFPRLYAALAQMVRPLLFVAIWLRNKLKK